jgi:hypothetical protein
MFFLSNQYLEITLKEMHLLLILLVIKQSMCIEHESNA